LKSVGWFTPARRASSFCDHPNALRRAVILSPSVTVFDL